MFGRYFRLTIPLGDISAAEMRAILDLAGDADAFGAELIRLANEYRPDATTRLRMFLELMEDYTQEDIRIDDSAEKTQSAALLQFSSHCDVR